MTPTVMSTGYEFTEEKEGDLPLIEGAKLCRGIRVATAKFVKLGIYITEPNFCVMILPEDETVAESFIDKSIKAGGAIIKNAESVALMRNLIASRGLDNIEAVMSDDKPLLTAIPPRVRLTKYHKTPIKFSEGFKAGLRPTEKDFVSFKQMSQSHVHEGVWIDNLSINRAITLKKGFHFKFKGLLTKYLKSEITPVDQKLLLTIISAEDLARVKSAYDAKEKIIQLYKDENLRKADQQALIDYISEHEELEIDDFEAEFLEIIANAEIISLLEDEILDLGEMSEVSSDILRELLYDDEVISLLKEERKSFDEVYSIYCEYIEDSDEGVGDFSFIKLCKLLTSNEIGFINLLFELEMNISDIIKLHDEDEEAFSELSKDKTIAFLKEYGSDIDYEYLIAIFNDNPDDVIQNIGVKDFIDR